MTARGAARWRAVPAVACVLALPGCSCRRGGAVAAGAAAPTPLDALSREPEDAAGDFPADARRSARAGNRSRHGHAGRGPSGEISLGDPSAAGRGQRWRQAGKRRLELRAAHGLRRHEPLVPRPRPAAGDGEAGGRGAVRHARDAPVGDGGCAQELQDHARRRAHGTHLGAGRAAGHRGRLPRARCSASIAGNSSA